MEVAKLDMPKWQIKDEAIVLEHDGEILNVLGLDIFRCEFRGQEQVGNLVVDRRPSEDLPHIRFSRFPLEIFLEVHEAPEGSQSVAHCRILLKGGGEFFELDHLPTAFDQWTEQGHWFPLISDNVSAVAQIISDGQIDLASGISVKQYLELLRGEHPEVVANGELFSDPTTRIGKRRVELGNGFVGRLYDYQQRGFEFLSHVAEEEIGCILGDEMGLGKTVQVIALIVAQSDLHSCNSLIISPATLLENWKRELQKFAPKLTVAVHQGPDRTGFPKELLKVDVVITSYDTACRDLSLLQMIGWQLVVLDEAQAIKNPDTMRARSIKQIERKIGIAVTGTPVENSLQDVWSIMDFCCPGLLGDRRSFEAKIDDDERGALLVEQLVSPLLLRRLVKDVAKDLPSRIDIPQALHMSTESAQNYEALRQQILEEYGTSGGLVSLIKLRQFCSHPSILREAPCADPTLESSKYQRLLEILYEVFSCKEKVIIFTSFTKMADLLVDDLTKRFKVYCESIDGRTPVEDRQSIVDNFSNIPGSAFLILNPKAAGTGLNITAANHVIHYNLEWNPAVEDQASARAYRRGQERPVTVHRLYYVGTLEEVIDERLSLKRDLADIAIVGHDGSTADTKDIARAISISPI